MLGHSIKRLSTSSLPCDHFSSLFSSVIYHYSQVQDLSHASAVLGICCQLFIFLIDHICCQLPYFSLTTNDASTFIFIDHICCQNVYFHRQHMLLAPIFSQATYAVKTYTSYRSHMLLAPIFLIDHICCQHLHFLQTTYAAITYIS